MRIFQHLEQLPTFKNPVITIGTYDGVHIGHQKILQRIGQLAKAIGGESILITFHPHPRTIVNDNYKIELLSPLEEKFDLLQQYGIDNVVVVPFTRAFSQQTPESYVKNFLVENFQPKKIVIGYDHRFGQGRVGNIDLLRTMSIDLGFEVEEISKQQIENIAVSSTKVRKAIQEGKVKRAKYLLGHAYFVRGIVVKGKQLGRKIGFPTANLRVENRNKLIPANGVYAVEIRVRQKKYLGMLNIGVRPTLQLATYRKTIEAHIFDFEENIYGEKIQINFLQRIRAEQKFAHLQALIIQLNKDKAVVLSIS